MPATEPSAVTKPADPAQSAGLPLEVVNRAREVHVPRKAGGGWKLLVAVGILFILIAAGWIFREELLRRIRGSEAAAEVQSDPKPPHIHALGRLEPLGETVAVGAPSGSNDARIETLHVVEGAAVESAALLATLDNERRLTAAKQLAENRVQQANAKLGQTKIVVNSSRASLDALLQAAEADVHTAQIHLERQLKLQRSAATTAEVVDQAKLAEAKFAAKVREVQANLLRYQSTPNGEPVDLAVARQDLAVAEASLAQAVADLEQAYVRAPYAGVVLDIRLHQGERIGQESLLTMGATAQMTARVDVYESDVRRLRVEQSVVLTAAALAEPLHGKVERIANYVKKQSVVDADPAANTDARVVEVWVRLTDESSVRAARYVDLQVRAEFLP